MFVHTLVKLVYAALYVFSFENGTKVTGFSILIQKLEPISFSTITLRVDTNDGLYLCTGIHFMSHPVRCLRADINALDIQLISINNRLPD